MKMNHYLQFISKVSVFVFTSIFVSSIHASGWNDYELEIDPGYSIVRCNSVDISLCTKNGGLVLLPNDYPGVGPIVQYIVTDTQIYTHHAGLKSNLRNPRLNDADETKAFYFVTEKVTAQVSGPFSLQEFGRAANIKDLDTLQWKKPRNPNIIRPLLGNLLFLLIILIPILMVVLFMFLITSIINHIHRKSIEKINS